MDLDSTTRLRRTPATWFLLALTGLITGAALFSAVQSLLKASGIVAVSDEEALESGIGRYGFFGAEGLRVAEGISLVLSLPVAITCLIVLIGMVTWREWAREAAMGVFGLSGLLLLVFSLNGLSQQGRNADIGLGISLLVLGVAALVLTPPVRDDFERRRLQKELRQREALAAARRARSQR